MWVTEEDGSSHRVLLRVIRPIEEVEKTVWTVVLTVVPVLLLAGCGAYICLRRRFR